MNDIINKICEKAYKATGSTTWDIKVIKWFNRSNYSPVNWKEDYLTYLKSILSK